MDAPAWLYDVDAEVARLGRRALGIVLNEAQADQFRTFCHESDPRAVGPSINNRTVRAVPLFYRGLPISIQPVSKPLVLQPDDGL